MTARLSNPALRLGVVLGSSWVPSWVSRAVELSTIEGLANLVAILVLENADVADPGLGPQPLLRNWYARFDAWAFQLEPNTIPGRRLDEIESWNRVSKRITGTAALASQLRDLDLDVAIWTSGAAPDTMAGLVRHGVWRWRFGAGDNIGLEEQSFRTVMTDSPVMTLRLTAVTGDGVETVLASSVGNATRFSARRTEIAIGRLAAHLFPRGLASLRTPVTRSLNPPHEPIRSASRRTARQLTSLTKRYLQHRLENFRRMDQWGLAFHRGQPAVAGAAITPGSYVDLIPPQDRDWADPFPLRVNGVDWVFFEELEYARGVGHLSVAPLGIHHFTTKPEPIVVKDYHLSYPFVFEHDGQHYLIPETAERQRLEVYRALRFPFEWEFDRVLQDVSAVVDATLAEIEGRWWLFACSLEEGVPPWGELHIYHARSPFGPWTPHRGNPVVTDVRHARPAGRVFRQGNKWFRPAQDCSIAYGHSLTVQEIEILSPEEYREKTVARLDPTWAPRLCGVHTLNATENLTLIDVRRRVWRPR